MFRRIQQMLGQRELSEMELKRELELSGLVLSELELSEMELKRELELSEMELKRMLVLSKLERELSETFMSWVYSLLGYTQNVLLNPPPKQAVHDPNIDLTGGLVEFLLRGVMKHDDLDDQLNSLEEAYVIDALRFGSKHPWWGIIAARFHLYWWSLITFTNKGIAMSPAGKLVRSVAKKWGF